MERNEDVSYRSIDFDEKFRLVKDYWSPKIVGRMNSDLVKIVKVKGEFTWHKHDETDEVFIVHKGMLKIDFRDGMVELHRGQMFIVPKGKEHKPSATEECEMILFEPETTLNTGDKRNELTKDRLEWI